MWGWRTLFPWFSAALLLFVWEWASRSFGLSESLLPSPTKIAFAFGEHRGYLLSAAKETIEVAVGGLILAVISAALVATGSYASRSIRAALTPFVLVLQVTPKIALAPVVFVLVKDIQVSKSAIAAILAFFPLLVALETGFRTVDARLGELLRVLGAGLVFRTFSVALPASAPWVLSALKIAVIYSLMGAITAEYIRPGAGLGDLILQAYSGLQFPVVFAAVATCTAIGMAGWAGASLFEKFCLRKLGMADPMSLAVA